MAAPRFQIPPEFQDKIKYVESQDPRSDEEIIESLANPPPVTSEKNIWAFWHSGIRQMPAWCQRNVANWSRIHGPSWTIRVLDNATDSPTNALNWVSADALPEAFVKGKMEGHNKGPHSADALRGICLYQYGGVWLDVGAILFRTLDDICWSKVVDPSTPYQLAGPWQASRIVVNHLIAARKGDPFVKYWHDLFLTLWKGQTSSDGIIAHPLMAFAMGISLEETEKRGFAWNWNVPLDKLLEYVAQIVCLYRVSVVQEPNGGFNGVEYFDNKFLLFDGLYEDWPAEALIGWSGEDLFDLLATRLDADPESEAYKKAYKTVWHLLTKTSMQKVTRTGGLTSTESLGALWDKEENKEKDHEAGTFAELLRYGSVHFQQDRETMWSTAPKADPILHKGMFEA